MFSCTTKNNCLIVSAIGKIDSTNATVFEQAVSTGLAESNPVGIVFDFSGLSYISSAGLRVVLTTLRLFQGKARRPALAGLSPLVREVFEIAGFLSFFDIYNRLEEVSTTN